MTAFATCACELWLRMMVKSETLVVELQVALNEYTRRVDNKASAVLLAWQEFLCEKRKG